MNIVQKAALVLTVIGALNWGLIGLFNFDLVFYLYVLNALMVATDLFLVYRYYIVNYLVNKEKKIISHYSWRLI